MGKPIEDFYRSTLGLVPPEGLGTAYENAPLALADLLYRPGLEPTSPPSLEWAIAAANDSAWPLEPGFVPLVAVDEASFACVVASPLGEKGHPLDGCVVRWHLTTEKRARQRDLLDVSVAQYLESVAEELAYRQAGLDRMYEQIGPVYEAAYLAKEKRPRDFIIRPVRLACQNVIVGLAAFGQDAAIDGLSVYAWQTCEVPHVATHDANRAMTALTLCDAFKNGGTMEIRFDQPGTVNEVTDADGRKLGPFPYDEGHPEKRVPASLRRYARTLGVDVGVRLDAAISPDEARELFLRVTPMPDELRERVDNAIERGMLTPERLCYTLMSQLWREIELDFLLATSDRAQSILTGGSNWQLRGERQAEMAIARAAKMVGMLYRRLDTKDAAAAEGEARVLEDNRWGVEWSVLEDFGVVSYYDVPDGLLPWQQGSSIELHNGDTLAAVARSWTTADDVELVRSLDGPGILPALIVPHNSLDPAKLTVDGVDCRGILVLSCPDRLGELDQAIEATLLTARMTRQ